MSKNKTIILGIAIAFTVGCRKDPHPVEEPPADNGCVEDWCDDLPPDEGLGYNYIIQGPQFLRPCFNPNNSNEFIYTRVGFASDIELVKYNLSTKQETVLLTPMNQGAADWGADGWIVFQGGGGTIWKIKDDGTQYAQVVGAGGANPRFGNSGKHFTTTGYSPPEIQGSYRPVFDLNGNLVDSSKYEFNNVFTGYPYHSLDSNFGNGYFFYSDHNWPGNEKVGVCKLTGNNSIEELNSYIYNGAQIDMDASSKFVVYSIFWKGLFKIDLSTMLTSKIKFACQTRYYLHLSMSPSGDKVLVEKVFCTPINNYDVDEKHEIWLIDLNGCNEEKILG